MHCFTTFRSTYIYDSPLPGNIPNSSFQNKVLYFQGLFWAPQRHCASAWPRMAVLAKNTNFWFPRGNLKWLFLYLIRHLRQWEVVDSHCFCGAQKSPSPESEVHKLCLVWGIVWQWGGGNSFLLLSNKQMKNCYCEIWLRNNRNYPQVWHLWIPSVYRCQKGLSYQPLSLMLPAKWGLEAVAGLRMHQNTKNIFWFYDKKNNWCLMRH